MNIKTVYFGVREYYFVPTSFNGIGDECGEVYISTPKGIKLLKEHYTIYKSTTITSKTPEKIIKEIKLLRCIN